MNKTQRLFLLIGAVFGFIAVAAGAFAAHGLEASVSAARLEVFQTASRYQMYHALALLAVGILFGRSATRWAAASGWLFVAGTVLFSGSLYLLVLTDTPWLGAITPFGGLALLAGWVALAVAVVRS